MLVITVSPGKTAELIKMLFGKQIGMFGGCIAA